MAHLQGRLVQGVEFYIPQWIAAGAGNMEQAFDALYTEAQDMLRAAFMAAEMG
jgi:hypothetical protein